LCKENNNVSTVPDFISKDIIGIDSSLKNSSFYVLPNAIRAIFKAINFYISGDMSLNEKLYAPAVLNFYTSAFHALESFLATNGILYFLPWLEGNTSRYYQRLMVLRYCHGNQWKIEPAEMNHVSRWKELRCFFKDEASTPPSFIRLFNYFFNYGMCENSILKNFLPDLKNKKNDYKDYVDQFLKKIPEIRHLSAYESFGSQPEVYSELLSGKSISIAGIDYQVNLYKSMAKELMTISLQTINELINENKFNSLSKKATIATIFYNIFDIPEFKKVPDPLLKANLLELKDWINRDRKRKLKISTR
jgi:hypothetical protein